MPSCSLLAIRTGIFTLMLLASSCLYAQIDTLYLANQYSPLKNLAVTINGQAYSSNEMGMVVLSSPAEQIVIAAQHHDTVTVAASQLTSTRKVTLHKHFTWTDLLTPMFYIVNGGLWLLLFIVFAETGLFAGFFLPGDSLLFVAGIYSSELAAEIPLIGTVGGDLINLLLLWILISVCGILGNFLGYWTGRKVGPAMYQWKDNFFFKKRYLHEAHDFFERHGALAIVGARFLPFIRTFAPIVAGIVDMSRTKFVFYNVFGSLLWVFSMLFAGHYLQKFVLNQFRFDLKSHLEIIVIGIVVITTAPVIWKIFFSKKKAAGTA